MTGFTHLHCHSEYSLLDGLARVPDLVSGAKKRGFDSLALTDHGVMFGAVQFYQMATKAGVKPILGCEIYVAPRTRSDRDPQFDRKPYHLTVLAENNEGYRNLMALVSHAQLEGYYYKPRADRELIARHGDGLIVLSGCAGSEVALHVRHGRMDAAREAVAWYSEVFSGRYYIELMVHDLPFIPRLNAGLLQLAGEFDLPTVATNDVHYCEASDVNAHEVLLCVQTNTNMNNPDRMRIGDTFYLRTEEEMRHLFADMEDAVDRTAEVAERCNVELTFNEYRLPKFDVPAGETAASYLRTLCEKGVAERYDDVDEEVRKRLDYELRIIHQMKFDDYFLIVWDLCRFAADNGIWWNVRGSGAGSIVAYALRITNIDPLAHKLIFERFLNPSRVSMPDIDLDFPDDQRDELIRYTFERYGHDKVAQIITFGTMGARAAIRDAGRALDIPLPEVDRIARIMPSVPGKSCGIQDALTPGTEDDPNEFYTPDLVEARERDQRIRNLLDTAQRLEGVARHASTHAAGVVVSDRPLVDYVPLHRPTRSGDTGDDEDIASTLAVTQYNMNDVERLGLLKVDFLGLATLTVLRRATELIAKYHDVKYTLDNIPLNDDAIYELLSSGHVTGVFQVEGAGMRRMLREMRPTRFEHVVAAIALYRPGPMEYIPTYIRRLHGQEEVSYRHPRLEPILAETFGIIVYQEQIIQIARDLAGYDAGEADTIRKAVGKKIKSKLLEHRNKFVEGAVENGLPQHAAEGIFDDIETFARYGFNKAHAADYAVIVCQTAFLKAKYPVEYAAALLSVERDDTDKIAQVAADCHRMQIPLLQPSVDRSDTDFTIEELDEQTRAEHETDRRRGIRFGMAAIKNVGSAAAEYILQAQQAGGPFADLEDFARRVDLRAVGKRALESLIKAGALDPLGGRAALLEAAERVVSLSATHHRAEEVGQMSLFGGSEETQGSMLDPLPDIEGDPKVELQWEKELIGLYLSDHPLHRAADTLGAIATHHTSDLEPAMDGEPITIAGLVANIRNITTRKGATMAFVRLEDLHGDVELIVFPRTWDATRNVWAEDRIVVVQGKVEHREDRLQVIVDAVQAHDAETSADAEDVPTDAWSVPATYDPAAESVDDGTADGVTDGGTRGWTTARFEDPRDAGDIGRLGSTPIAAANRDAAPSGAGEEPATETALPDSVLSPQELKTAPEGEGWAPLAFDVQPDARWAPTEDGPSEDSLAAVDASESTPDSDRSRSARDEPAGAGESAEASPDGEPVAAQPHGPVPTNGGGAVSREANDPVGQPADEQVGEPTGSARSAASAAPEAEPVEPSTARPDAEDAEDAEIPTLVPTLGEPEDATGNLRDNPDAPRYALSITVPRTQDHDEAIGLMRTVFDTLTDFDGADRFSLLVPHGPEWVELEFPNHNTRYCVDLLGRLKDMVGEEHIQVRCT